MFYFESSIIIITGLIVGETLINDMTLVLLQSTSSSILEFSIGISGSARRVGVYNCTVSEL